MALTFHKFHGAGNDFILIDDRQGEFKEQVKEPQSHIYQLCRRHFGIGADGLMLLRNTAEADFEMVYYNRDGRPGSMCGNGGRCIVAFAESQGIIAEKTTFKASDGLHHATINHKGINMWDISLQLNDVNNIQGHSREFALDTGSPHLVLFSENIPEKDVNAEGRDIRYSPTFAREGINVNFAEVLDKNTLRMRTYERGVENETLACGTGATAVALAAWTAGFQNENHAYRLLVPGGELRVSFCPPHGDNKNFSDIWLSGPATKVFSGSIEI